ncbi:Down syndrome critical region protein 3 homolog, partial [Eumeta japonica]
MEGSVNLQLSTKNVGIFEAFYNSVKPINLLHTSVELAAPGKIPAGTTEIPFEIPLQAKQAVSPGYPGLLESYHGVFVSI